MSGILSTYRQIFRCHSEYQNKLIGCGEMNYFAVAMSVPICQFVAERLEILMLSNNMIGRDSVRMNVDGFMECH